MKRYLLRTRFIFISLIFLAAAVATGYLTYYYLDVSTLEYAKLVSLLFVVLTIVLYSASLVFIFIFTSVEKNAKIKDLDLKIKKWTNISYHASEAGDEAFNHLPIGIMLYDTDNQIVWVNNYSKEIFHSNLVDSTIASISTELKDSVLNGERELTFKYGDMSYDVVHNPEIRTIYFFDSTERENIKKRYNERITAIAIIEIDNLEESLKKYDMQDRANIRGQILGVVSEYMAKHGCYLQTLAGDRMTVIMDKVELLAMIDDKFSLLDRIREIATNNRLKASISMGVACYDGSYEESGQLAQNAIELAQKRGGDQVVVNLEGEQIKFFGAKNNSLEKNTLVEARMQTMSLKEAVEASSDVIIMCHKFSDTDAFGSMIAAFHMISSSNVNVKMAFDPELADETVKKVWKFVEKEPALRANFIDGAKALEEIEPTTLLLITDTQSPSLVMFPELYAQARRVSIIDHHRPGEVGYNNYLTYYLDSSASSAVELVSEMFMFYNPNITMTQLEASILLSGIIVDTNNFTQRSGSRTFEAAATLKTLGADMIFVRKLLQEPIHIEKFLSAAVSKSEIYGKRFSIVCLFEDDKIPDRTTLAKISDEQLKIAGVDASFTIGRINENTVGISARSLGDTINVQTIMEQMGGGGHFNSAATQRKDVTIQDLKAELTEILRIEYVEGGNEIMKIILVADVKGKGKKGDIIDVANGYGNFLINNKQALAATEDNLQKYEEEKAKQEAEKAANRKLLLKFKNEIQGKSISIKIKVGQGGKKFGNITTKLVCDEFESQTGIHLDKKKVELPIGINSIGIFTATVKLDVDIVAQFEIKVEEQA